MKCFVVLKQLLPKAVLMHIMHVQILNFKWMFWFSSVCVMLSGDNFAAETTGICGLVLFFYVLHYCPLVYTTDL